ncbi:hypothetical protein EVAR_24496_1 [Eumeta japonica]|uniref:Uncharacterized protein n=1 Tax=Eumeta variegata TaxID=151549 RepID=A0A4C1UQU9_EUMVA|nr:hypothetical protein EVAR_24496_1 [Eumeta japonica]
MQSKYFTTSPKAFGRVDYETLIGNQESFSSEGFALGLLKPYLSNGVQSVDVNCKKVVYILYIASRTAAVSVNESSSLVEDVREIVLFVNDTSSLFKVETQQRMCDDVQRIHEDI